MVMSAGNPIKSDRLPNGYFAKGNKIGRMKKKGYTLADLTKTVMAYEKTHDETILKHYIKRLKENDKLLENFINKYVPNKTINELVGAEGGPIEIIKRVYSKQDENTNST